MLQVNLESPFGRKRHSKGKILQLAVPILFNRLHNILSEMLPLLTRHVGIYHRRHWLTSLYIAIDVAL